MSQYPHRSVAKRNLFGSGFYGRSQDRKGKKKTFFQHSWLAMNFWTFIAENPDAAKSITRKVSSKRQIKNPFLIVFQDSWLAVIRHSRGFLIFSDRSVELPKKKHLNKKGNADNQYRHTSLLRRSLNRAWIHSSAELFCMFWISDRSGVYSRTGIGGADAASVCCASDFPSTRMWHSYHLSLILLGNWWGFGNWQCFVRFSFPSGPTLQKQIPTWQLGAQI